MKIIISTLLLISASASLSAVTITSFGNVAAPTFAVDNGFTTFSSVSQNASSLDISGADNSDLFGTFSAIDLTSFATNDLTVSGSISTSQATTFTLTLTDGSFNSAQYVGGAWTDFAGGSSTLTFSSLSGAFDWSDVSGAFLTGGGGGDTVTLSLTGLSIVPEPSTYAALSGFLALTWVMLRRRRA